MNTELTPPKQLTQFTWIERIVEWFQLIRIVLNLKTERSDLTYNVLSQHHVMGDDTLFINLGYWDNADTLDEAAIELADHLAKKADLKADEKILDVGFGFGDQDIYWCKKYELNDLHGINISSVQVNVAQERVKKEGLDQRLFLREGSATDLPYDSQSFDKVVGLECAFHFCTRDDFLAEAYRALKPGGEITLADFIARGNVKKTFKKRVAIFLGRRSWQIPAYNLYEQNVYREKLEALGFKDIQFELINDHVFSQFVEYQRKRFDTDNFKKRYHPLIRFVAKLQIDWGFLDTLDYVVVTAKK